MAGDGEADSIVGIASFGLQLATTLQTYIQTTREYRERLGEIVSDINATASAVEQLQDLLDADEEVQEEHGKEKVFRAEGRQEIQSLIVRCGKLYTTIVVLLKKSGANGEKNDVATLPVESKDFEFTMLTISTLTKLKWPWLEPRIKGCQEQLRWTKISLLFNLQLATLARFQISTIQRAPGNFAEEMGIRVMAEKLRQQKIKSTKRLNIKHGQRQNSIRDSSTTVDIKSELSVTNSRQGSSPSAHSIADMTSEQAILPLAPPISKPGGNQENEPSIDGNSNREQNSLQNPGIRFPSRDLTETEIADSAPSATMVADNESATVEGSRISSSEGEIKKAEDALTYPMFHNSARGSTEDTEGTVPQVPRHILKIDNTRCAQFEFRTSRDRKKNFISWLRRVFRLPDATFKDRDGEELEAYMFVSEFQTVNLIPLEQNDLKFGLKSFKPQQESFWGPFSSLDPAHHEKVNQFLDERIREDGKDRKFVAFETFCEPVDRMIIYFSVGKAAEPVKLEDWRGQEFLIPFHSSRTWKDMHKAITEAFNQFTIIGPHVEAGQYDLFTHDKQQILPTFWGNVVKPGCRVKILMRPNWEDLPPFICTYPNRCGPPMAPPPEALNAGPRVGGPPPPPPRWQGPPPPPGPPGWIGPLPTGTFPVYRPCKSVSSVADSEIEDGPEDFGIDIDFEKEDKENELALGELLGRWTNAIDTLIDPLIESDDDDGATISSFSSLSDD